MEFIKKMFFNHKKFKNTGLFFSVMFCLITIPSCAKNDKNQEIKTDNIKKNNQIMEESNGLLVVIDFDLDLANAYYEKHNIDVSQLSTSIKEFGPPQADALKKISTLDMVAFYDSVISSFFQSNQYKQIPTILRDYSENSDYPHFSLTGTSSPKLLDIKLNKIYLTEGEHFSQNQIDNGAHVVIISERFAKHNNLKVGDNLNISPSVFNEPEHDYDTGITPLYKQKIIPAKIVGLYELTKEEVEVRSQDIILDDSISDFYNDNVYNQIYVPNKFASEVTIEYLKLTKELYNDDFTYNEIESTKTYFMLKDPNLLDKFSKEILPYVNEDQGVFSDPNQLFGQGIPNSQIEFSLYAYIGEYKKIPIENKNDNNTAEYIKKSILELLSK